jgi:hypothetical protein
VRIEWSAKVDALFDNGHACIRELITRTSANGEFAVPAWNARHGVSDVVWEAQLLEPGYRTHEEDQNPSMALPGYRHHLIARIAANHPPLPDHRAIAGGEFACWEYPQSE